MSATTKFFADIGSTDALEARAQVSSAAAAATPEQAGEATGLSRTLKKVAAVGFAGLVALNVVAFLDIKSALDGTPAEAPAPLAAAAGLTVPHAMQSSAQRAIEDAAWSHSMDEGTRAMQLEFQAAEARAGQAAKIRVKGGEVCYVVQQHQAAAVAPNGGLPGLDVATVGAVDCNKLARANAKIDRQAHQLERKGQLEQAAGLRNTIQPLLDSPVEAQQVAHTQNDSHHKRFEVNLERWRHDQQQQLLLGQQAPTPGVTPG